MGCIQTSSDPVVVGPGSVLNWQRLQPMIGLPGKQTNLQPSSDSTATVIIIFQQTLMYLQLCHQQHQRCNRQSHSFIEIFVLFAERYFSCSISAIIKDEMPEVDKVQWPLSITVKGECTLPILGGPRANRYDL